MLKIAAQMAVVVNLTRKNQDSMTQAQTIVMITATLIVIALTVIPTVVMVVVTMVMMLMGDNDGSGDYGDYDNTGSDDGSDDLGHGDGNCSCEEHCDINKNEDDEVQFDSMMFQPIYDNASISLCVALCAIMVFKRSNNLSFSCIASLLQLLQLLCPVGNKLPHSVYSIKKFFKMFSSTSTKRCYCSNCEEELCDRQQKCNKVTCKYFEPNTLIRFNAINSIKIIMACK